MRALELGCGTSPRPNTDDIEYVNLDRADLPGVDLVYDLEFLGEGERLPYPDDHFDRIEGSHILEHLHHLLPIMGELWRVTKPGGTALFAVPYGGSDEAWCDPTHVRAFYQGSWAYLAAPTYWMSDYGYRGDWALERVRLRIPQSRIAGMSDQDIYEYVLHGRNIVHEMVAELRAVKPARVPDGPPTLRTNLMLELIDGEPNQVSF